MNTIDSDFMELCSFQGESKGHISVSVREDGAMRLNCPNQVFTREDIKVFRSVLKQILRDTKA